MITKNFHRKMKKLSKTFNQISEKFMKLYKNTYVPNIFQFKKKSKLKELRNSSRRELKVNKYNRFYRPTGFDMFKMDELRRRRKDVLDIPYKHFALDEWLQMAKREKKWYKLKAEEHLEKIKSKYGGVYLEKPPENKNSRRYNLRGNEG